MKLNSLNIYIAPRPFRAQRGKSVDCGRATATTNIKHNRVLDMVMMFWIPRREAVRLLCHLVLTAVAPV